jgi:hypothetical protein
MQRGADVSWCAGTYIVQQVLTILPGMRTLESCLCAAAALPWCVLQLLL